MTDDFTDLALRWRGVDDPCLRCHGSGTGTVLYSSGATWRGGMGTAYMARDVCDACWGTGDRYRTGCDLRRLRDEESKRVAEAAVSRLAEKAGAQMPTCYGAVRVIAETLQKLADKRGAPAALQKLADKRGAPAAQWVPEMAAALAKELRRAIGGGT